MLFNYVIGNTLTKNNKKTDKCKQSSRNSTFTVGVVANLGLLGYFKYSDFLIENVNYAFNSGIPSLNLALPLAISFFTFQQIAYLVDSYRRETSEYDFLNYAVFVTFFPQLIAGPIVHHKEVMPQFSNVRTKIINYRNISLGLFIFSIGLFKKVVIADSFSIWANFGFNSVNVLNIFEAWTTSLSYTFQLYFDFSGYTDMAIGLALLFNIKLPINFNSPYKATSIQDFWRRWHITLSRFLRDYIYIPLGGNRKGSFRTSANLMTTFILGGIWHGAGWTFVFWGVLHGAALVVHRLWGKLGIRLWAWLSWLITFNFINITWVFFRAEEWNDAIKIIKSMFCLDNIMLPNGLEGRLPKFGNYQVQYGEWLSNIHGDKWTIVWLLIAIPFVLIMNNSMQAAASFKTNKYYLVCTVLIMCTALSLLNTASEFLYFNF